MPQYVIDAPGGGGKIPVNPEYVIQRTDDRVLLRNYEGKVFEYPEMGGAPARIQPAAPVAPLAGRRW